MTREDLNQRYTKLCTTLGDLISKAEQVKLEIAMVQEQGNRLAAREAAVAEALAAEKAKIAAAATEIVNENAPLLEKLAGAQNGNNA